MERARLIAGLREFAGAALVERDGACFLVDPAWGERERAQWAALAARRPKDWDGRRGWLCVPTGGSSGVMKLARHDELTLGAAAEGFARFFELERVDAVGLLPPWHVSGLMAWARCAWTGGLHRAARWREIEAGRDRPAGAGAFLSLVPTQLARLLGDADAETWLRGFRAVFLGGAPSGRELTRRARAAGLPVALCYGSTETAAMVTAQRPEEFLAGDESAGRALPHANVVVETDGRVAVAGAGLFRGYWPEARAEADARWRSDDLGEIDAAGRLRVLGRADALIISGGEKVNPAEVEAVVREAAGAAWADVAVVGVPHAEWGEEVVALFVSGSAGGDTEARVRARVAEGLAAAKRPKRYVPVSPERWPVNASGKRDRVALRMLAA